MSMVFPGVDDVMANALRPVSILMRLLFPHIASSDKGKFRQRIGWAFAIIGVAD